jgi:hypothetical protein
MDAFVALLLSQLPNLRSLHMEENFTRKSRFIGIVFRSALCKECCPFRTRFEHLQSVYAVYRRLRFDIREPTDERNTADVLPFFYLSSIEQLATSIDNPITAIEWPAAHPPNPAEPRSLEVSMIREGYLGHLLSLTSKL